MNKSQALSAQSASLAMSRRQCLQAALSVGIASLTGFSIDARGESSSELLVPIDTYAPNGKHVGTQRMPKVVKSLEAWRSQLSPESFHVTRQAGTEIAFTGSLVNNHAAGLYHCICCSTALFDSRTKYESGTGWPSFWKAISTHNVAESEDRLMYVPRTAVSCARCDAHLGHVFDDGPQPTGLRYCMNSVSLSFTAFA